MTQKAMGGLRRVIGRSRALGERYRIHANGHPFLPSISFITLTRPHAHLLRLISLSRFDSEMADDTSAMHVEEPHAPAAADDAAASEAHTEGTPAPDDGTATDAAASDEKKPTPRKRRAPAAPPAGTLVVPMTARGAWLLTGTRGGAPPFRSRQNRPSAEPARRPLVERARNRLLIVWVRGYRWNPCVRPCVRMNAPSFSMWLQLHVCTYL